MVLPLLDRISNNEFKLIYKWYMRNGFACCQLCGSREDLTFDHIIPKIRGGGNGLNNLCFMCKTCNVKKGSRIIHGLIPLSIESPYIHTALVYDLVPGMKTLFGEVEALGFVGSYSNKDMYVIEFSGENPIASVMTAKQLRDRLSARRPNVHSRPGSQEVPLDPRFCLV